MRKGMPEFVAIPMVIVVFVILFVILWASHAGVVAWLVVGAIMLAALLALAAVAMRRPRGIVASGDTGPFDSAAAPLDDGVHRLLVVTDGSCATCDLEQLVATRGERGTTALVVAPAVSSRTARWTGDEQAYKQAEEHRDATIEALAKLGVEATGHVGSHDPLQAADDGLREFPADEILFVLCGSGEAGWLEQGLVEAARARYRVPVRDLALSPEDRAAG